MAKFDKDTVANLVRLSRIDCSNEEIAEFEEKLSDVLKHIDHLTAVDTKGVKPCNHVLAEVCNVMREDEITEVLPREVFLANAPAEVGGMVRVPPVIKQQ